MNITATVAAIGVLLIIAGGWYAKQQYDAEQRGRQKERDSIAAETNQKIAERRVRDATFDRTEAMQLCKDAGLEWYAADGRSYCRVKPIVE